MKGELVLFATMQKDMVPMGQPPLEWEGGGGEEGTGWAHRKGGESGGTGEHSKPFIQHKAGEEGWLCEVWMSSQSSTGTSLWLWKGLLCKATDLLDTPCAESKPALKVNSPALDWIWIWKSHRAVRGTYTHKLCHVAVPHTRAVF